MIIELYTWKKKKTSAICESMQTFYHVQELERQKIIIIRRKRIPPKTKKEYRPYCHIQQHRTVLL